MITILLALQAASCAPSALCRTLEAAVAVRRTALAGPGYRGAVETEMATLSRWEGRIEGAAIQEQVHGRVAWSADALFHEHIVGWRSSTNAIPLTTLAVIRIGWLVPTTSDERLKVVHRSSPLRYKGIGSMWEMRQVIHPLALDRALFYRFAGGEEVSRAIGGSERRVIAILVSPRPGAPDKATLFEGEMDLDPATRGLIRLYGRFKPVTPIKRGRLGLARLSEPDETLVDLVNRQLPDGSWVPDTQRFENESISRRTWGFGSALRIMSRFYDLEPLPGSHINGINSSAESVLSAATADSLHRFQGWRTPAGAMTHVATGADFAPLRSAKLQPAGPPVVTVQGYLPGEFLRINKVEGVYTGVSLLTRLRDRAPGLAFHVTGGYAWAEDVVRGRVGAGWQRGRWTLEAGAARELNVTNKFRDQFDSPVLGALVGRDNWDYLERRGAGFLVTRRLGHSGSLARVDIVAADDRALTRHMTRSLGGWRLRDNRAITEGHYLRTRALLDWNPEVSPGFAGTGLGFRGEVEHAGGDLDYTRLEARIVGRAGINRLSVFARLHGGVVIADRPPPQQLFEIGGPAGLPGYDYKEFAGDRAALFRTRITYALPLLDTRRRLGAGVTLPAPAPAISIGFNAGIAGAHTGAGRAAVAFLGIKRNESTGEPILNPGDGNPLPAAVADGRVHTSIDLRFGLFGDALAVGIARALDRGRGTQFIVAFGRQI